MTIDKSLINRLFDQAVVNPRLRINLDLRNSETDGSPRMLNAMMCQVHRSQSTGIQTHQRA